MRVCLVTPELPPFHYGGIGQYVAILAQGLSALGHQVTVLGWKIAPVGSPPPAWGEVVSVDWRLPWRLWKFDRTLDPLGSLKAAIAVRRHFAAAGDRYDVVEVPNWRGDGALLPAMSSLIVSRLSTSANDVADSLTPTQRKAVLFAERRTCRRAGVLISHSNAMARKGAALYGVTLPTVVPLGLEPVGVPHQRDDPFVDLVFIGRAELRKGTDVALQSLHQVMGRERHLRATFVGANLDGFVADRPDLARLLKALRAWPDRFVERRRLDEDEKLAVIAQADWLVTPSRFESFGIVAIEAMRAGTPVIVTTGSGLEEVGRESEDTIFVEPGSVESLSRALLLAVEKGPAHKSGITRRVRAVFDDRFTAARMVRTTEAIYQQALGSRGRP